MGRGTKDEGRKFRPSSFALRPFFVVALSTYVNHHVIFYYYICRHVGYALYWC
jgi:hypothetical protein